MVLPVMNWTIQTMASLNDTELFQEMCNQAFFNRSYVKVAPHDDDIRLIVDPRVSTALSTALEKSDEHDALSILKNRQTILHKTDWSFCEDFCRDWKLSGNGRLAICHDELMQKVLCNFEFFEELRKLCRHDTPFAIQNQSLNDRKSCGRSVAHLKIIQCFGSGISRIGEVLNSLMEQDFLSKNHDSDILPILILHSPISSSAELRVDTADFNEAIQLLRRVHIDRLQEIPEDIRDTLGNISNAVLESIPIVSKTDFDCKNVLKSLTDIVKLCKFLELDIVSKLRMRPPLLLVNMKLLETTNDYSLGFLLTPSNTIDAIDFPSDLPPIIDARNVWPSLVCTAPCLKVGTNPDECERNTSDVDGVYCVLRFRKCHFRPHFIWIGHNRSNTVHFEDIGRYISKNL
ncbi:hypothetical protein BC936DRAFT_143637 [Jimgerdemannia flammicorona]|uniref:Uncharacterized protein n=1 Tax=Jimgerdemannia flammicorona TaxID=994334 RepID=A0A433DDN5_9FUNG|nr:hypothetical protein BC936DRAFT_143637 [Jimgerdemannia flammicorona]